MAGAANLDFSQAIFVHREADDTCLTVIFHDLHVFRAVSCRLRSARPRSGAACISSCLPMWWLNSGSLRKGIAFII